MLGRLGVVADAEDAEDVNGAPAPDTADTERPSPRRWKQPLTTKQIKEGQHVGTCGHVGAGTPAYLFNGHFRHSEVDDIFWLAVCAACAEKADFDLEQVEITEVVVFS